MSDRWIKPDFQDISVSGECTAYAGTQDALEINPLTAVRSPLAAIRSPLSAQDESGSPLAASR